MTDEESRPSKVSGVMRTPDAYVLLLLVAFLAYLATWLVPPGMFETALPDGGGRERIVPGTFTLAAAPDPAPLLWTDERAGLASFLFEGLVSGSRNGATVGLMAFLLIVGGVFGIVMRTGSLDRGLTVLLKPGSGKAQNGSLIFVLFVLFSLCGAVFGLSEEAIVLTLIVVPALVRAGYDSLVGVLVTYGASQIGFATSWMNPFNVVIAQGIADVPILSGLEFRLCLWVILTTIGAAFAWRYARRVRLDPETSLAYVSDAKLRSSDNQAASLGKFTRADALILAIVALGVGWVAWGVTTQGYYLAEMAAQFFVIGAMTALAALAARFEDINAGALMEAFRLGAMQMTPAILVVAAAKGIVALLGGDLPGQFSVLNTILDTAGSLTSALPDWATAWGMFLVQAGLNLVIVSGSGQAALTMPLMAPLADLTGVSRQTAVLAFQLGDGLTNLLTPASAALMGCLAAARLDWVIWLRFIWKPLVALLAFASAAVLLAHAISYH